MTLSRLVAMGGPLTVTLLAHNSFFPYQEVWEQLPDRLTVGGQYGTTCQVVAGYLLVIDGNQSPVVEVSG